MVRSRSAITETILLMKISWGLSQNGCSPFNASLIMSHNRGQIVQLIPSFVSSISSIYRRTQPRYLLHPTLSGWVSASHGVRRERETPSVFVCGTAIVCFILHYTPHSCDISLLIYVPSCLPVLNVNVNIMHLTCLTISSVCVLSSENTKQHWHSTNQRSHLCSTHSDGTIPAQ